MSFTQSYGRQFVQSPARQRQVGPVPDRILTADQITYAKDNATDALAKCIPPETAGWADIVVESPVNPSAYRQHYEWFDYSAIAPYGKIESSRDDASFPVLGTEAFFAWLGAPVNVFLDPADLAEDDPRLQLASNTFGYTSALISGYAYKTGYYRTYQYPSGPYVPYFVGQLGRFTLGFLTSFWIGRTSYDFDYNSGTGLYYNPHLTGTVTVIGEYESEIGTTVYVPFPFSNVGDEASNRLKACFSIIGESPSAWATRTGYTLA
jgi:hypothetical protein